jgi:regulator of ribosome biosynthesis
LNKIWKLPIETVVETTVAKMPAPTFNFPTEKPIPKLKPSTKWKKYAQEKGVTKTQK